MSITFFAIYLLEREKHQNSIVFTILIYSFVISKLNVRLRMINRSRWFNFNTFECKTHKPVYTIELEAMHSIWK